MHNSTGRDSSSSYAQGVIEHLATWLRDDDHQVRFETARALASLGDRGLPTLIAASRADNPDIRSIAAWGLGLTDKVEAVDPLLSALADQNSGVRFWAANALGRLGTLSSPRALSPLTQTLRDESPDVRATVIEALGAIGDTRALPYIIAALQDAHGMVRRVAIESLGRFKNSPAVVDALLPMLGDESDTFCKAAAVSLSQVGEPAFSALLTVLAGGGGRARQWAAIALGHTKDRRAVEPLARAAADADARVRAGAVEALGMIGDEAACEPVLAALDDQDRWVRLQVIRALGQVDGRKALDTLLHLLASDDDGISVQAAMSLGRRGDLRAIQPLLAALRQGVRSYLYLALLQAAGARLMPSDYLRRHCMTIAAQFADVPWTHWRGRTTQQRLMLLPGCYTTQILTCGGARPVRSRGSIVQRQSRLSLQR